MIKWLTLKYHFDRMLKPQLYQLTKHIMINVERINRTQNSTALWTEFWDVSPQSKFN